MGQKIIQGDLLVKGTLIEEGISLDTKWSQLSNDVIYSVTFNQRFTISKICKRSYGQSAVEWHLSDGRYSYFFLSEYNLTAENTIAEILAITNTLGNISWNYSTTADVIQYGYDGDTVESALQTLEEEVINVREVAEGKCNTYVLSYNDTIASCKSACNRQSYFYVYNLQDKVWENKVNELLAGDFDSYTICNEAFNSTSDAIYPATVSNATYLIVRSTEALKTTTEYTTPTTAYYLLPLKYYGANHETLNILTKTGDIFLVIETDVPDRWYGGSFTPLNFYKMETTKVELSTVNNGKLSIQLGGTEKASFTANQSGDTTLNITKTDITNLGIPSENTWRPVQNNLTSTSTTDALSAAQGKALNDKFGSYATNKYLEDCLKGCINTSSNSQAKSGSLTLSGVLYMGEGLPNMGDGSKIYRNKDIILNRRSAGISGMYANSAQTNLFYGLAYNPKYLCTCNYKGDGEHTVTTVGDGDWQAYKYSNSEDKSGYVAYLFDGCFTTGATFPVDQLATKPVVLTVTTVGGENIDATDTLYVTLNGWRYEGYSSSGNYYGSVSGFYLEILDSATNTWVKSFEYNGDPINMDSISFPVFSTVAKETLGITSTYTFIKGIRLTVTAATAGSSGKFGITEFKLMETRPAGKPSNGVGAVDVMGGTIYGDINLASKYLDSKIQPQTNNTNYLGTNTNQWRGIYGKTIYEDGTSLGNRYLGINSTAVDSSKLSGQEASYYLNYNNFTNTPTIPAAQVNSDWNATEGVAQILNKPNLATVATSGNYNDLSNTPTIPAAVTETTVAGWGFTKNTGTSNFSGSYTDLTNKPTIPEAATTVAIGDNGYVTSNLLAQQLYVNGGHNHDGVYLKGSISNGVLTITE